MVPSARTNHGTWASARGGLRAGAIPPMLMSLAGWSTLMPTGSSSRGTGVSHRGTRRHRGPGSGWLRGCARRGPGRRWARQRGRHLSRRLAGAGRRAPGPRPRRLRRRGLVGRRRRRCTRWLSRASARTSPWSRCTTHGRGPMCRLHGATTQATAGSWRATRGSMGQEQTPPRHWILNATLLDADGDVVVLPLVMSRGLFGYHQFAVSVASRPDGGHEVVLCVDPPANTRVRIRGRMAIAACGSATRPQRR